MIVNKRYYDYDYDNNRIIMFDADDSGVAQGTLSLAATDSADEKEADPSAQVSQSVSTETVPDDPILGASSNPNEKEDSKENKTTPEPEPKKSPDSAAQGRVTWISSSSPKGTRRIPYAATFCHSYTINKLEVTLTQLVDTRTVQRQKQQKQQAQQQQQALAMRAKWAQQQQLRYGYGPVPAVPPPPHGHAHAHGHYRAPYPAPHAQGYPHYRGHPAAAYGRGHAAPAPPVSGSRKEADSPYLAHAQPRPHPHAFYAPGGAAATTVDAASAATQSKPL